MVDGFYVVMPAYNEGRTIAQVVSRTKSLFPQVSLIVIDDGSSDNTAKEAANAGAEIVKLPFNCGYGVALQAGLLRAYRAGARLVVTLDADGQHEPEEIRWLVEPVINGKADVVLGSRYLADSRTYPVRLSRRLASFCMAKLLSIFLGQSFTDTTTGFQCLGAKALGIISDLDDFPEKAPDADLLLYLAIHGCQIREVPVRMHSDSGGDSMHGPLKSLWYLPQMCTSILGVMLEHAFHR